MRLPLSWLSDLVELDLDPDQKDQVDELLRVLAGLGLVPEAVTRIPPALPGVVTARVEEIHPIPGADRIRRVGLEAAGPVEVVCGAWNFSVGDVVALARPGARLPGLDQPLAARTLRGVRSEGMLCSAVELGWGRDGAGLVLLERTTPIGQPVSEVFGLGADWVLDLEIPGNRPDALSVRGVARDLAAKLSRPLRPLRRFPSPIGRTEAPVGVKIEAPELCGRLAVRYLRIGGPRPSVPLVARRLELSGVRPIGAVVDATNYVMLELGQPTHAYDLGTLASPVLVARAARRGERLRTLDGVERDLGDDGPDCVIADPAGRVLGIAGVMGGAESEITDETREVLLEAAWFDPLSVSRTARRLGLRTEAAVRFERGVDPALALEALERVTEVLGASGPLEAGDPVAAEGRLPPAARIRLRPARVRDLLGIDLDAEELGARLAPAGFVPVSTPDLPRSPSGRPAGEDALVVDVPSFRPDCREEVDLVEEVARLVGYDQLTPEDRRPPQVGRLDERQRLRRRLRVVAEALGADEVWTPTLVPVTDAGLTGEAEPVTVANPLVPEERALRASLLAGLVRAVAVNVARTPGEGVRLYEIGKVFRRPSEPGPERGDEGGRPETGRTARDRTARDPSDGGPSAEGPGTEGPGDRATPADIDRTPGEAAVGDAGEPGEVDESEEIALLLADDDDDGVAAVRAWRAVEDALRLEGVRLVNRHLPGLHPSRAAVILDSDGRRLGGVGEVDLELARAFGVGRRLGWLALDVDALRVARRRPATVVPPSRYPPAEFDLAVVAPVGVPAAEIADALAGAAGDVLESLRLLDTYRSPTLGPEVRSLTWRVRVAASDRTLGVDDLARLRHALLAAAESCGAVLRS